MSNPPCPRCGKQNPADIHTCTPTWATEADTDDLLRLGKLPKPLALADALEKTMQWPLHGKAAAELRRLHAENEQLKAVLRRVIRTYMVADDAWDHDAELERIYQREMKK